MTIALNRDVEKLNARAIDRAEWAGDCNKLAGVLSMPPQMSSSQPDTSQPAHAEIQPTAADCTDLPFADGGQIAVVLLAKWLDWVTQKNQDVFVALPMIQRGSVWKANAIADLWDSLLRGMPVGSLTVSRFETETQAAIRLLGETRAQTKTVKKGSLSLLDGQQRTLAMCIGWKEDMDRRVWVDFGQPGIAGQPFRLRVTTKYQPFGFNQNDQSKKLQRWERRKAREDFDTKSDNRTQFKGKLDFELPLDEAEPYGAVYPLELRRLIQDWQSSAQNIDTWVQNVFHRRSLPYAAPKDEIERRIRRFVEALRQLFQTEIALVRVKQELVEHDAADEDDNTQPSLVVLFERIANGGTRLSNSDYIFSLIKHRFPDAHNLVQELYEKGTISSLLSANDLVMTAVRLAANTNTHDGGKPFPDNPTPNPKEFGRMLKVNVDGGGDFLGSALMPLIKSDSRLSLHNAFQEAHKLLEFRPDLNPPDLGLPRLALPLLQRQLVQVLVFWIHLQQRRVALAETLRQKYDASRPEVLRFVLFWLLCVEDKEAAAKTAFEMLRDDEVGLFPGKAIYKRLCKDELAICLQHPDTIKPSACSSRTPGFKIRTWGSRFNLNETDSTIIRDARKLYARWFHRKELLLWLQREMLVAVFKRADPLAGREEETPYDYDHICPHNDWGRAGYGVRTALRGFCEDSASWIVGNSIGNYRVWDSSSNREDQDDPAPCKLGLTEMDSVETQKLLEHSAITSEEAYGWKSCSAAKRDQGHWDETRALAFQEVVEARAFRLFEKYFKEGSFTDWVPTSGSIENLDSEITGKTDVKS